jgi:hypothetical protein
MPRSTAFPAYQVHGKYHFTLPETVAQGYHRSEI